MLKVWYNKYSERERKSSKGHLNKSPIPLAVDHSARQKVVKPPDSEKELSESRANKSGKKFFQKTLDKTVKMCYNNYGERERNPKPNT